jgi:hypothetical protein
MQKNWKDKNPKQLYLLHIPKTGGTSVSATLGHLFDKAGLCWHKNARPPHNYNFSDFVFIDSHLGNCSKIISDETAVACLVRNPIDRSISNFLWIYNSVLMKNQRYYKISNILERLKFYLFDDEDYAFHRNLQSKFICNSVSPLVFSDDFKFNYEDYSKNWFIDDSAVSTELAIKNLNKFEIVGVTENHDKFMDQVSRWVFLNTGLKLNKDNYQFVLKSEVKNMGTVITTKALLSELNSLDILRIIENNQHDFEIYEYVKQNQITEPLGSPNSVIV